MTLRNAIVISVDRFSAGYLGPYGNTWIDTPAINRLASQATLFENVLSDSPLLAQVYQSYWQGAHAMFGSAPPKTRGLPGQLATSGIPSILVTDCAELDDDLLADGFSDQIVLDPELPDRPALDATQTHTAQLFAATNQWLRDAQPPFLLWVHAQAMDRIWDAPMQLRAQFADEEDPPPSSTIMAPNIRLERDFDPDELLGFTHAYAGQVAVLDLCIGALVDAIDEHLAGQETLVVLTSPRGFPLGEHGSIGACGDQLYSEVLQVPCLIRHPDPQTSGRRCHTLIQHPDLYATLLDWFGQPLGDDQPYRRSLLPLMTGEPAWTRQVAIALGNQQLAIRTPAWFLVSKTENPPELFVKPDDRWEVNEVADRCELIASQLDELLRQIANADHFTDLPELPEELVNPW